MERCKSNVNWILWGSAVGLTTAVAVEMVRRGRGDTLIGPLGPLLFGGAAIVIGALAILGLLVAMTPRNERDLARKLACFVVSIVVGFAALSLLACRSEVAVAPRSPQANSIRAAWANQLAILAGDERYAVARNDAHLIAFRRDRDDAWRVSAELPFAPDWRGAVEGGFTTNVDTDRLRAAYGRYLDWCAKPTASAPPWSSRSPLASRSSHDFLILVDRAPDVADDRDWSRLALRCVGSEGRYAWFIVTNLGHLYSDGYCGWVTQADRLIVLRADDGKEWRVYDEAVIDSGER